MKTSLSQANTTSAVMFLTARYRHGRIILLNLLLILPEFLNSEDVEFISVDVRQETVRLSDRLALRCAPAVSHQIHAITCAQHTHTHRNWQVSCVQQETSAEMNSF